MWIRLTGEVLVPFNWLSMPQPIPNADHTTASTSPMSTGLLEYSQLTTGELLSIIMLLALYFFSVYIPMYISLSLTLHSPLISPLSSPISPPPSSLPYLLLISPYLPYLSLYHFHFIFTYLSTYPGPTNHQKVEELL